MSVEGALLGLLAAILLGSRKQKASFRILPWKTEEVTISAWDGAGRAVHVDNVPDKATPIPGARVLSAREQEALAEAVAAWNDAFEKAGKRRRYKLIPSAPADVTVYGSGKLKKGRSGETVLWARDGIIQRATIAVYDINVIGHELGHGAGIDGHTPGGIMASRARRLLPIADDAKVF